jgi:hypothetical protein
VYVTIVLGMGLREGAVLNASGRERHVGVVVASGRVVRAAHMAMAAAVGVLLDNGTVVCVGVALVYLVWLAYKIVER